MPRPELVWDEHRYGGRRNDPRFTSARESLIRTYERLLANAPVVRSDYLDGWAVLGYHAVRDVLRDESFVSYTVIRHMAERLAEATGHDFTSLCQLHDHIVFFMDPPAHGPARRLLARPLARQSAVTLRPAIEALVQRELQRVRQNGGFDLVRDFAVRFRAMSWR